MNKILVIEDEKDISENIQALLELYGYEVEISPNGMDGIKKVNEIKPNLILCDIMMPGIDGYEVKKIIENSVETADIPFVFLSAKAEMKDVREGMNLGADDYLTKPFNKDELLNVIKIRLNKKTVKKNKSNGNSKILLKSGLTNKVVDFEEVDYIEANGNYTNLYLSNSKKVLYRRLIKEWIDLLDENKFVRVSQSTIVRIDSIDEIIMLTKRNYVIKCKNRGDSIKISQRYLSDVLDIFN